MGPCGRGQLITGNWASDEPALKAQAKAANARMRRWPPRSATTVLCLAVLMVLAHLLKLEMLTAATRRQSLRCRRRG